MRGTDVTPHAHGAHATWLARDPRARHAHIDRTRSRALASASSRFESDRRVVLKRPFAAIAHGSCGGSAVGHRQERRAAAAPARLSLTAAEGVAVLLLLRCSFFCARRTAIARCSPGAMPHAP